MELQINDLVSSIKKEGIDAANAEAEKIISDAKKKAQEIISDANEKAKEIKNKNEKDISVLRESAVLSAEHAKRDAMLSFKEAVKAEYQKILSADLDKALNPEVLAKLIKAALAGENPGDYAAEISEVADGLKSQLAGEIKNGLELKPTPGVKVGFRLASKDNSGYFDCSDEEIAKMLEPFFPELNI